MQEADNRGGEALFTLQELQATLDANDPLKTFQHPHPEQRLTLAQWKQEAGVQILVNLMHLTSGRLRIRENRLERVEREDLSCLQQIIVRVLEFYDYIFGRGRTQHQD